jgi:hypothetical protein
MDNSTLQILDHKLSMPPIFRNLIRGSQSIIAAAQNEFQSHHPRNTGPMLSSQRCGAKTRSGKPCMAPAVSGKTRCRMHGGAAGSGAPHGNKNALKHGHYTRQGELHATTLASFRKIALAVNENHLVFAFIPIS